MQLTTTRTIAAPIDVVWATQLDHERWPEHLPNFRRIVRRDPGAPFGVGSSAAITQPAMGTVEWTVLTFEEAPERRSFAWSGTTMGATWVGRHVVRREGERTELTLGIEVDGGLMWILGPLLRSTLQKAIDDEAAAFERWALGRV